MPADGVVWLKLIGPVIQAIRSFRALMRERRRKLVFVKRSFSGWASGQTDQGQIIHLRGQFALTNSHEQDAVIVTRLAALARNRGSHTPRRSRHLGQPEIGGRSCLRR